MPPAMKSKDYSEPVQGRSECTSVPNTWDFARTGKVRSPPSQESASRLRVLARAPEKCPCADDKRQSSHENGYSCREREVSIGRYSKWGRSISNGNPHKDGD